MTNKLDLLLKLDDIEFQAKMIKELLRQIVELLRKERQ